jgi:hypothetical protein
MEPTLDRLRSWRAFYAAVGLLFASGNMSKNGRDKEYAPVVNALAPVLSEVRLKVLLASLVLVAAVGTVVLARFHLP